MQPGPDGSCWDKPLSRCHNSTLCPSWCSLSTAMCSLSAMISCIRPLHGCAGVPSPPRVLPGAPRWDGPAQHSPEGCRNVLPTDPHLPFPPVLLLVPPAHLLRFFHAQRQHHGLNPSSPSFPRAHSPCAILGSVFSWPWHWAGDPALSAWVISLQCPLWIMCSQASVVLWAARSPSSCGAGEPTTPQQSLH